MSIVTLGFPGLVVTLGFSASGVTPPVTLTAYPDPFSATSTVVTSDPDPFSATSTLKGS